MADCIYDQAFMSLRAGNGNIYETEYDVVEVSAAVKNPVCEFSACTDIYIAQNTDAYKYACCV